MRATPMLLIFCCLAPARVLAQQQEGQMGTGQPTNRPALHTIRGQVSLPNGQMVNTYVRLTLRLTTQERVREAHTDSLGNFEFKDVPSNQYELVAWGTDDFETTVERIELSGNISYTETRHIYLREKEEVKPAPPKPGVVSVRELDQTIPKAARREYQRGVKASTNGRREQAVVHFQRAIEIYDRFVQAHNDLGVQYLRLGRWDEARAAFTKAISLEPGMRPPYVNLGYVQIQQRQYEEAVRTLTRAVELDATDWRGHLWLGVGLMEAKQETQAEQELTKALQLSQPPDGSVTHLYLANLYIRRGDLARAVAHGEAYLQEYPNAADAQEVRDKLDQMRTQAQTKDQEPGTKD